MSEDKTVDVLEAICSVLVRIEKLLEEKVRPPHPLAAHLEDSAKANAPQE